MKIIKHTATEFIAEKPGHRIEMVRRGAPEATVEFFRDGIKRVCSHTTWYSHLDYYTLQQIFTSLEHDKLSKQEYALAELHKFLLAPDWASSELPKGNEVMTAKATIKTETVVTKKVILELTPEQAAWLYVLTDSSRVRQKEPSDSNVAVGDSLRRLFDKQLYGTIKPDFISGRWYYDLDLDKFNGLVNSLRG